MVDSACLVRLVRHSVHAALRASPCFIGTTNRSRLGRLERDPLEIDLSISAEAIYADFFGGLYGLTIAFYLLQLSLLVLAF